ncbi:MAG TPA: NAD(P)-binding domain-containing protein, partial [bacterium]
MAKQNIGLIGLGVMGQNLVLNMERNGFSIIGYDLDQAKLKASEKVFERKNIIVAYSLKEFLQHLESPKKIMMMVPAGKAVDSVIHDLKPHLATGDLLIDGG